MGNNNNSNSHRERVIVFLLNTLAAWRSPHSVASAPMAHKPTAVEACASLLRGLFMRRRPRCDLRRAVRFRQTGF
jgi:hypothetical protein